jgi:hypothetical protein
MSYEASEPPCASALIDLRTWRASCLLGGRAGVTWRNSRHGARYILARRRRRGRKAVTEDGSLDDQFDYGTLWRLLAHVARGRRLLRFADAATDVPERFVLLRHDVDYSPEAALRLAELEAERGIRASYFVLPSSPYYNLLSPAHAAFPGRLAELGHEVGLHYDVRFLRAFPRERWLELLQRQAELLQDLSGAPVVSIAMHQPALHGEDPFRGGPFLNAYDDRFFREIGYISDSCRAWRDHAWSVVSGGSAPPRLQLALHPINWGERDRPRERIFEQVHARRQQELGDLGRELLAQIAVHGGVQEHEARRARQGGGLAAASWPAGDP